MQNAGLQYGEGVAPVQESPFVSTPVQNSSSNSTSSLRQFRKKENVEKAAGVNGGAASQDSANSSHVARVAPHNHYPHKQNEYFRYPPQYQEYNSPYKEATVKYSEIAEPVIQPIPHLDHLPPSVLTKHKEKEYVEMCNIPQQSHLNKPYPEHQFNGQQSYPPEMSMHHQYMHKEPQGSQMHSSYKPESQYIPKEGVFNHQIPPFLKYNIPQSRNFGPLDNSSLNPFQRMDPHLARSFMTDHHHIREFPTEYSPMEQSRMYAQKQRYYPTPLPPSNSTYPPNYPHTRNIPAQQYNYPSCNYPRSAQMNSPMGRYPMNVERSMSPRRAYQENMDMTMNFPPVPQKISANYPNYPAYAQHYQQRRPAAVPQEYYHPQQHPHARTHAQYMPNHHPQEITENHVASNNIRQYLENWAEEEPSTEIISRLNREEPNEVYVINASELPQYLENGVPLIASENGQYIFKSNVSIDNTGAIKILDKTVENASVPTDAQERVVSLHIIENPKADCLVNRPSNTNPEHQVATNQPAATINVIATNSNHRPYNQPGYNPNRMNMVHQVSPMAQNCDTSINLSLHHQNAPNSPHRNNSRSPEKLRTNPDPDQMKTQALSYHEVPQNSCIVMPSAQNRLNFDESLLPNPVPCDAKQKKDFEVRNDDNSVISNVMNEEALLKEAHEELDKIVQDTLTSTNMHMPLDGCEKSQIEENLNSRIPDFLNLDLDANPKDLRTNEDEAIIDLSTTSRRTSETVEQQCAVSVSSNQVEDTKNEQTEEKDEHNNEDQPEDAEEDRETSPIKHMPLIFDGFEDHDLSKVENETSRSETKTQDEHQDTTEGKVEDPKENIEEKTEFVPKEETEIISETLETKPQVSLTEEPPAALEESKPEETIREDDEPSVELPEMPETEETCNEDSKKEDETCTEETVQENEDSKTSKAEEENVENKEEEETVVQVESSEELNTVEVASSGVKRKRIFSVDDIIYRIGSTPNQIQKIFSNYDKENEEHTNEKTSCEDTNEQSSEVQQKEEEEVSTEKKPEDIKGEEIIIENKPQNTNEESSEVQQNEEEEVLTEQKPEGEEMIIENKPDNAREENSYTNNEEDSDKTTTIEENEMNSTSKETEDLKEESNFFGPKGDETLSQNVEMSESSEIQDELPESVSVEESTLEDPKTMNTIENKDNNNTISFEDEETRKTQIVLTNNGPSLENKPEDIPPEPLEKEEIHSSEVTEEKSNDSQETTTSENFETPHSRELEETKEDIKISSEETEIEENKEIETTKAQNLPDVGTENLKRSQPETDTQNEAEEDEERSNKKIKLDESEPIEEREDQKTVPEEVRAEEEEKKPCRFSVIHRTETLHKEITVPVEEITTNETSCTTIEVQEEETLSCTGDILEESPGLELQSDEESKEISLLPDEPAETKEDLGTLKKPSKEEITFEQRFVEPLLKEKSHQEEKSPAEAFQYRSVLKIEENTVLLEICGELVEISVNQINGKKVITVVPISNTATVDMNDNYEQADRVHHGEDIACSSEMPELYEETSEDPVEEDEEKKLPVLVKMNSEEDEGDSRRNEEITSTQTEANNEDIFEDIILNENEIIIGDESLEEEINLDLKSDVVPEERPVFCTKAAKKLYEDTPVPPKTHSTLRDFRKVKTKPEQTHSDEKMNDEGKDNKSTKGFKRASTRPRNGSELKEESQVALQELIKQRKMRKEKIRLKYSQFEETEVSDKPATVKNRPEKGVKSEIRKVSKVEKNQVSSVVHKVKNGGDTKRKEPSDVHGTKTKCKEKIRRKSLEESREKIHLIASVIVKEPCSNSDSDKKKPEEKPTSTSPNPATSPKDVSAQNFQDGRTSNIVEVTKYNIQEKHTKFPKISTPRDLSLTKNINEHYLSRKDHSNLKKKLSIQEYNSRKRKMVEGKVSTPEKIVKVEEPQKAQCAEKNQVRPSTIYSGRQFENISNCVKDPRRLQFMNSGRAGLLRANSEDSSSSRMPNISPYRSLSTETIPSESAIIIDPLLNQISTDDHLKNYNSSTTEKLFLEVNESRTINTTNRRKSTETTDKKNEPLEKMKRKVSFDDNVQINEIHTTQNVRTKQDSSSSCCEVTSSCSDNFDEKTYLLDKTEETSQEYPNLITKIQKAAKFRNDWEDSNSPKDCITDAFADSFLDKTKLETLKTTKSKLIIDINDFDTSSINNELKNSYKNNEVGLKNYKEEIDSKLNSLNLQIPKTIKNRVLNEDNILMHKFLRKEQLSSEEIKQIRRIIYYKKKIQQLTQQNLNTNVKPPEENYEIKKSPEELKLQFKKVDGKVKKKKKRFRNLYSNSPETSENEVQETAGEFSVYEGENISGVKLIFKRKTDFLNLQPVVKIQRCKYIDSMAKNLKYE